MRREALLEPTIELPNCSTRRNEETPVDREEPMEEVLVDVDEPMARVVVEKLSRRKGEMHGMRPSGSGKVRLTFQIPTREG